MKKKPCFVKICYNTKIALLFSLISRQFVNRTVDLSITVLELTFQKENVVYTRN